MTEWIAGILLILGSVFVLFSSIGLLRFPDLYIRMHATTKASSVGMLLMLTGVVIYFPTLPVFVKALFIIVYIFMTSPVAAHMIGRAGHLMKVPKWHLTHRDDLEKDDEATQTRKKK